MSSPLFAQGCKSRRMLILACVFFIGTNNMGLFTPTPVPTPTMRPKQVSSPVSFQKQRAMEEYLGSKPTPISFQKSMAMQSYINSGGTKTGSGTQPAGQVQGISTQNTGDQGSVSSPSINDQLQSGYNDYYSQLDQMLAGLGGQQTNMVNIANQQTAQQQSNLDLQNQQGENTLNQYQDKSLKNIGETIAAGMRAGNNMLGSVGAGDSSAANQYSYALAKEGSKQRGGVMQDVSQRLGNLKMTYNTAKNNLVSGLNQRISEISQWFAEQQNQIRGMKAEAAKQYSDQALSIALSQLQTAQQQVANQRTALDNWVANNATSIQQATQQMQQNAANLPMPTAFNTQPQVNQMAGNRLFSQYNLSDEKPTLFNRNTFQTTG